MKVSNTNVYNLEEAIKASKYPMLDDANKATNKITNTVKKLGSMDRGTGHDNFLHGILVSFDLTCSNKMWVEFQRYHFADIVSSQSTMHRVAKILETDVFNEYVTDATKHAVFMCLKQYNLNPTTENYLRLLYNIPSGIELTAHVVTNYGQLKTMWYQRHNHQLPEWREFCEWIINLPYFNTLTNVLTEKENEYADH